MRRVEHELDSSDAFAVAATHQALRENGAQVVCKVHKDLRMLFLREHVDNAIERFCRVYFKPKAKPFRLR